MDSFFFFSQLRNKRCKTCLRNAIKSKTTHSRDWWHGGRAGSFIAEMKWNKDTRYKQIVDLSIY